MAGAVVEDDVDGQALCDPNWYPTGEKISDAYATIPLTPHECHGEWNCTIAQ